MCNASSISSRFNYLILGGHFDFRSVRLNWDRQKCLFFHFWDRPAVRVVPDWDRTGYARVQLISKNGTVLVPFQNNFTLDWDRIAVKF